MLPAEKNNVAKTRTKSRIAELKGRQLKIFLKILNILCLQFANCSDTEMFLCADDLSDSNAPWQISSDQFDKLVQWWDKMMDKTSDDLDLAEELYLKVISR